MVTAPTTTCHRRRRGGRPGKWAAAAACSALLAAGCSTASGGGSSSSAPIHFAVLASYTGPFSDIGKAMWAGAKSGAAAVNAAGGIMGRKLIVDLVDTVGDPADAVTALNKEVASNSPVGVIGPTTSEIFGVHQILDRDKLPFMFEGGSTVFDNNTDPYLWRSNPSDSQLGVAMAAWAFKQGYKTGAVTFSVESSAQTLKNIVIKAFQANGGRILIDENLSIGQTSYRSEVTRVNAAHPQVVFLQTEPVSAGPYFADWKELNGLSVPFIGSDLTAGSDFIKAVTPGLAHAHIHSAIGSALGGGGTATFNKYYAQTWHAQPLGGANYAYDGVLDLALAMDKAGSTSPAAVLKAIPEVSNPPGVMATSYAQGLADLKAGKKINYEGASGPTDYNQFHNVYGPFDIVQSTASGNITTLYTFSAKQLQCMTEGKGLSC